MAATKVKVETPKKAAPIDPVEIVEEIGAIVNGKPWYTSKTLGTAALGILTAVGTHLGYITPEQCIALEGALTMVALAFMRINPTTPLTK